MISVGETYPIIYEMRISAEELDLLLIQLQKGDPEKGLYGEIQQRLTENFKKLQAIRNVNGLRRYGLMDSSRNNWK